MAGSRVLLAVCLSFLAAASVVSAVTPAWYPGPKFQVNADAQASNTFVGEVTPTGKNQLSGTITMTEAGSSVDAQNKQLKDVIITYGPEDPAAPVRVGAIGPGTTKYVQDPSLEGPTGVAGTGLNIQLNAKPGYHFVSVSFGVVVFAGSRITDAFFVDGLGSSSVGSGKITVDSLVSFSEGKFSASNIYAPQITLVPNYPNSRFALDNVAYVLEQDN